MFRHDLAVYDVVKCVEIYRRILRSSFGGRCILFLQNNNTESFLIHCFEFDVSQRISVLKDSSSVRPSVFKFCFLEG